MRHTASLVNLLQTWNILWSYIHCKLAKFFSNFNHWNWVFSTILTILNMKFANIQNPADINTIKIIIVIKHYEVGLSDTRSRCLEVNIHCFLKHQRQFFDWWIIFLDFFLDHGDSTFFGPCVLEKLNIYLRNKWLVVPVKRTCPILRKLVEVAKCKIMNLFTEKFPGKLLSM